MKKRIFSLLLAICMVLMLVPTTVFAETTSDGSFDYSVSGDEVTIDKYKGSATAVEIPGQIEG